MAEDAARTSRNTLVIPRKLAVRQQNVGKLLA